MTTRQKIYAAMAVVGAIILYAWWKGRHYVLDASNSTAMGNLFDQLNPTIGGTATPTPTPATPINYIPRTPTPVVQNWFPVQGSSPPIIVDHEPMPQVFA